MNANTIQIKPTGAVDVNVDKGQVASAYRKRLEEAHRNYSEGCISAANARSREDLSSSLELLNRAIELLPNKAEFYKARGKVHFDLNQEVRAAKDFTRCLEKQQLQHNRHQTQLSQLQEQNSKEKVGGNDPSPQQPEGSADSAAQQNVLKPDLECLFHRALCYSILGPDHWYKAAADLEQVIEIDPSNYEAHAIRAHLFKEQGDLDQAVECYSIAAELDSRCVVAYVNRGRIYKRLGDLRNALSDLTTAVELEPHNEEYSSALYRLGKTVIKEEPSLFSAVKIPSAILNKIIHDR